MARSAPAISQSNESVALHALSSNQLLKILLDVLQKSSSQKSEFGLEVLVNVLNGLTDAKRLPSLRFAPFVLGVWKLENSDELQIKKLRKSCISFALEKGSIDSSLVTLLDEWTDLRRFANLEEDLRWTLVLGLNQLVVLLPAARVKRMLSEIGFEKLLISNGNNKQKLTELSISLRKSLESQRQQQLNESVLAELHQLSIQCYQNAKISNDGREETESLIDSLANLMLTLPSELGLNCISMDFKQPTIGNVERSIRVSSLIVKKTNEITTTDESSTTTTTTTAQTTKVYGKLLSNIRTMLISLSDPTLVRVGTNCVSYLVDSLATIKEENQKIQFLSDSLDTLSICVNPHLGLYVFERCAIRLGRAVLFDYQIACDYLFHSIEETNELWQNTEDNNESNIEKYVQFVACILPRLFVIPVFQPICENFLSRFSNLMDLSFSNPNLISMEKEKKLPSSFANNLLFKKHLIALIIGFKSTQKWNSSSIWKETHSLVKSKFQ